MNLTDKTKTFSAILRLTFLFGAIFFLVNVPRTVGDDAEPIPNVVFLDSEGETIWEDDSITLNSSTYPLVEDINRIIIDGGTLKVEGGTMVHLTSENNHILIKGGGTLIIESADGTGFYSGVPWDEYDDEEYDSFPTKHTTLTIDGKGLIQIVASGSELLIADTIDTVIEQGSVGTIDIAEGVTLQSGTISGKGNAVKTGEGALQTSTVNIVGNFTVEAGTIEFNKTAIIYGNFLIGQKSKPAGEDDEGIPFPAQVASNGTVTFHDMAYIGGNLTIEAGTVEFLDTATIDGKLDVQAEAENVFLGGDTTVGMLNTAAGTTIVGGEILVNTGEDDDPIGVTTLPKLTVTNGGTVNGALEDIGYLLVGGGTLSLEGDAHTIGQIGIARGATLNIGTGTSIQLGSPLSDTEHVNDFHVEGTLQISTDSFGISKEDGSDVRLGLTYGVLEIYKGTGSDSLNMPALHIFVNEGGIIIVENGATFESGDIDLIGGDNERYIIVDGGGTYKAGNIYVGGGSFVIRSERNDEGEIINGTTVEFSQIGAGELYMEYKTQVNAFGSAVLGTVTIAGNYNGNANDLTIQNGGWITGQVTDVNVFTQGGELLLAVGCTSEEEDEYGNPVLAPVPTISVEKWEFIQGIPSRVRTIAGTQTGTYFNVIQVTDDTTRDELLGVLNSGTTALYNPHWYSVGDETYIHLNLEILTINEYISNKWKQSGQNLHNVGQLLEDLSMQPEFYQYRDYLEGLDDSHLQSALRSALAGELAGNAMRIAMQQPAHSIFRHLETVAPIRSPFGITRGQVREGYNVWFNPYGSAENASKEAGTTFDGYTMSQFGFHVGGDIEIYRRAVAGVFFGYANPNVKSDLGKISAHDYTAGLYFRTAILNAKKPSFECCPDEYLYLGVMLNMMLGFGSQDYVYKNPFGNSNFRGSSLFGSVELTKTVPLPFHFGYLTPLIAMDFQKATMDSFIVSDPHLVGVLIEPDDLSQAAVRIGLLGRFPGGCMDRVRTRLQYIRQIAGKDTVYSRTSMIWDLSSATQVQGTQWGKDWLNVGFGSEVLRTRHWRIFADYDFSLGKQTTAHLGSINIVLKW